MASASERAAARRNSTPSSRSSTCVRSSAEWIRRAASSDSIVLIGKKPYATVPNASRSQCESVKPAQQSGASFAPGSVSLDPVRDRRPERRVERGARAAPALDRLEVVVAVAEDLAHDRLDVLGRLPGQEPAVDDDLARARDDVPPLGRLDHRRRERAARAAARSSRPRAGRLRRAGRAPRRARAARRARRRGTPATSGPIEGSGR